jgi:hypothetical protein
MARTSARSAPEELENSVRKVLNSHGYAFQHAVLDRAVTLNKSGASTWEFDVAEFPVETNGSHTHIDFLLRNQTRSAFLVVECKRLSGRWCFVRAPRTLSEPTDTPVLEFIQWLNDGVIAGGGGMSMGAHKLYHHGFVIKDQRQEDDARSAKNQRPIHDAAAQVLRGLNGLVNHLATQPRMHNSSINIRLCPVVVTTAKLYTSEVDLTNADIATGELRARGLALEERPWLQFQYCQSADLKHAFSAADNPLFATLAAATFGPFPQWNLGAQKQQAYIRTIFVVSAGGLDEFLSAFTLP